jgi:hypothetical protein
MDEKKLRCPASRPDQDVVLVLIAGQVLVNHRILVGLMQNPWHVGQASMRCCVVVQNTERRRGAAANGIQEACRH